jgi:hypothetical protein
MMLRDYEKRILQSFIKRLDTIQVALNSIAENIESSRHANKPQQLPVTIKSELQLPETINDYYRSKKKKIDRPPIRQWASVIISAGTLAAIIWYTCVTQRQWKAMIQSNDTARSSLEISQRAYLYVSSAEYIPNGVKIRIINFGHLAASIIDSTFVYQRINISSGEILEERKVHVPSGAAVPPTQTPLFSLMLEIPKLTPRDEKSVMAGQQEIAIVGALNFDTGFKGTDKIVINVVGVKGIWSRLDEGIGIYVDGSPNKTDKH